MQGSGYSTDPDGPRDNLLGVWALAAAIGSIQIERATNQAVASFAFSDGGLLLEWEQEMRLRQDAVRTDLERQTRLVAMLRAKGATRAIAERAVRTLASTAAVEAVTREMVVADAVEDEAIFQSRVRIDAADFDVAKIRNGIAAVMGRLLSARTRGQLGWVHPDAVVTGPNDAAWATSAHLLDRDALRRQTATTYATPVHAPSRVRSYGPTSKLRARDLNDWQDLSLFAPANNLASSYFASAEHGGDFVAFAVVVANGADVILDASIDWRDRYTMVRARRSGTDIRPGHTDSSYGGSLLNYYSGLAYWGSGGVAYRLPLEGAPPGLDLQVSTIDGSMHITNSMGATRYVAGWLLATRDLGRR